MPPLAKFQYTSLDGLATDTIRLLQLQPGADDQDIACTISPVCLSDHPVYTALSYVWGPPDEDHWIWLNNAQFRVRRNLWRCLWHLRRQRCFGPTWIDAICVSQDNMRERTHQVAFMSQIYSNARRVIAWLGENKNGTVDVLESRGEHGVFRKFLAKGYVCRRNDASAQVDGTICDRCRIVLGVWNALAYVGRCEYWTRRWIVQEIALARSVVISIGDVMFHFKDYLSVVQLEQEDRLFEFSGPCLYSRTMYTYDMLLKAESPLLRSDHDIEWGTSKPILMLLSRLHASGHQERRIYSLRTLLTGCRKLRCSDIRDRIFAILSLSNDFSGLRPDYERTPLELYHRLATARELNTGELRDLRDELQLTDAECGIKPR